MGFTIFGGLAQMRIGKFGILAVLAVLAVLVAGCPSETTGSTQGDADAGTPEVTPLSRDEIDLDPGVAEAPAATLRRLTSSQYRNTLSQWFGEELVPPTSLEPDSPSAGLYAVGASVNGLSALGVERYFSAAKNVAAQLVEYAPLRDAVLVCDPGADEQGCLATIVNTWGLRLWRRPLTDEESARILAVANEAIEVLGTFDEGMRYALITLLSSPKFLYVHAATDGDEARPYDSWEMATRLALFLWNSGPDEGLLEAAAAGLLTDSADLLGVVHGMLAHDRARRGIRAFTDDWLELDLLETLGKDPEAFLYFSPDIGILAREETRALVEHLVFAEDADFRTLMTTTTTFADRRLAAIYGVEAGAPDGFAQVSLPEDGPRAGLLGHVGVLALHASPNRSSPTLRGVFVRERLLCQTMPPPPANVDTTIPEGSENAQTMRERLSVHLESPACAGCHALTDLVGLSLERFDGLGSYRTTENGAVIDPSGTMDGFIYEDARGLGETIAQHPGFVACIVDTLWSYANGRERAEEEDAEVGALRDRFAASGYRMLALLEDIVMSEQFRRVGPPHGDDEGVDGEVTQ